MIVIVHQGWVPAPVEYVWAVVGDLHALPSWLSGARGVTADGPAGLGRRLWLAGPAGGAGGGAGGVGGGAGAGGAGLGRAAEIIAWKPPTLVAWRYVSGDERQGGPDELHAQLGQDGSGTNVQLYAVSRAGPLAGLALRAGPVRRWRRDLASSTAALRQLVTASAPSA